MSKEKIKVRQWPLDAAWEFINGSGFDTKTIKRLNDYGTEEQKRNFIHERRVDAGLGILALTAIVGSDLTYAAIKNHGNPFGGYHPAPIEQHGDHHGSTGMPSQQQLEKFTAEHGIKLNQK